MIPPLNLLDNYISIDFYHFLFSYRCIEKGLPKTSKCMNFLFLSYQGASRKRPLKQEGSVTGIFHWKTQKEKGSENYTSWFHQEWTPKLKILEIINSTLKQTAIIYWESFNTCDCHILLGKLRAVLQHFTPIIGSW